MAQFSDMVITRAGLDMVAESQAGGTLIFTKAKLGDGQIGEEEIVDLTDVISEKMEAAPNSVTASSTGHVEIQFVVDNTDLDVGFFVREIGIFAKVNESGTEQLYAYANAGNYTNYLSDKSTPIDSIVVKIDLVVGDASEVSFTTDKSLVYVTQENLEAHDADEDAHVAKIATQEEAEAGENNVKFMTPLRTAQEIEALVPDISITEDGGKITVTQGESTSTFNVIKSVNGVSGDDSGDVPLTAGTGISISNTTISGAYTAGTGISISGAAISGNYTGGTGISVSGNTISLTSTYQGTWSISSGTNGYARESSTGFTIQWGYSATNTTVTFPRTFSKACYAIAVGTYSNSGNNQNTDVYSITTSSFYLNHGQPAYWIAVGV